MLEIDAPSLVMSGCAVNTCENDSKNNRVQQKANKSQTDKVKAVTLNYDSNVFLREQC